MRSRSACWAHDDGRQATISALSSVFLAHKHQISTQDVDLYSTTNMASNIDVAKLLEHSDMLSDLIALDTRGALLAQSDCVAALSEALGADFGGDAISRQEKLELIGYKIRVMAAHVRSSFDNSACHAEHPLATLFAKMKAPTTGDAKRQRRCERLNAHARPNPFYQFPRQGEGEGRE